MKTLEKLRFSKGFTLIELLIVIGILGVLAASLLVALNPQEAQRKSRDTKRMRDAGTLQAILDQMVQDGVAVGTCLAAAAGCNSSGVAAGTTSQPCATNWLGVNVCVYAREVPLDPVNANNRDSLTGAGTAAAPARAAAVAQYRARIVGGEYEVNTIMESNSNFSKVAGDGTVNRWYEIGTNLTLLAN